MNLSNKKKRDLNHATCNHAFLSKTSKWYTCDCNHHHHPPPPTHTLPPTQAHTYKTLVFIFCYKLKKVIYDLLKAMTKLSILTGFIELKVESLREIGNAAIWDLVGCVATSVY